MILLMVHIYLLFFHNFFIIAIFSIAIREYTDIQEVLLLLGPRPIQIGSFSFYLTCGLSGKRYNTND